VVHPPGRVVLSSGELHPVSGRTDDLAPHQNSSPLSYMELAPDAALRVLSRTSATTPHETFACTFSQQVAPMRSTLYLGILQGESVILRANRSPRAESGCLHLSLQPVHSPALTSHHLSITTLTRVLIPIKRIYTLYLDRMRTLRVISHRSAQDSSPQPVITNLPAFTFLLQPHPESGNMELRAELLRNRKVLASKVSSVSRESALNLLLNWRDEL
jgi:hypothetical protein